MVYPRDKNGELDYSSLITCVCSQKEVEERRCKAFLRYCNLPIGHERMSFDNFKTAGYPSLREAVSISRAIAREESPYRWLTLCAETDRGKSHLSVAICREWIARGKAARFAFVPAMLQELKNGFELSGEFSYRSMLNMLVNVPLLALDDLGTERVSDWGLEQLQMIINERSMKDNYLIVSTNRPINNLFGTGTEQSRLANMRVASRLQRESWCKVIVLDSPEHRLW
jgi:DNA replication protein DnaC